MSGSKAIQACRSLRQTVWVMNYDYKCKGFELKAVNRSEFETLRQFRDYTELQDGTLMRIEGNKEFRIYRDDVDGCPFHVVTRGFCSMLEEAYDVCIQGQQDSNGEGRVK
jgi:hypothetical protein